MTFSVFLNLMIKDQKDSGEVYVMGTLAFEEVKQIVKKEMKK